MEYRTLKGTDLRLSAVCFGTIWFAAAANRPDIDTEEGKKAMHLALDSGVNCIHTSYEYETRPVVRAVLDERPDRDRLFHIIKVPSPDANCGHEAWEPDYFRKLIEDALADLGVERIDVVQWILRDRSMSKPDLSVDRFEAIREDVAATFEKMRDEGKVGHLGTFCYNNAYTRAAARSGMFRALMFYYNLWDTTLYPSFDTIRDRGCSLIPFRPFQGGMLTQKRADRAALPTDDKFSDEKGREKLRLRDEILKNAGIETDDLTRFALKFDLACDLVTTIITGMNTREQVREICAAVDGDYPAPEIAARVHEAATALGGPWSL